jgi:hypothetical protein
MSAADQELECVWDFEVVDGCERNLARVANRVTRLVDAFG